MARDDRARRRFPVGLTLNTLDDSDKNTRSPIAKVGKVAVDTLIERVNRAQRDRMAAKKQHGPVKVIFHKDDTSEVAMKERLQWAAMVADIKGKHGIT